MVDVTLDHKGQPLFTDEKTTAIKDRFYQLVCVMARLRNNCPWDREQTPDSLKKYVLEEAYEVLECIENRDWEGLREELGDFIFQVAFQAQIQSEEGRFDMEDVLAGIVSKMVSRHPHVFENQQLTAGQVAKNWERIKAAEKGPSQSLYDHFTKGLPALLESYKIGKKAARVGFDWPEPARVMEKISEEMEEVSQAASSHSPEHLQEELGDLLFAMSNLVRKYGFEPEETLRAANKKFVARFRKMEDLSRQAGRNFEDLDLDSQEALWELAKAEGRKESLS